ncbi:MAG: sigma-54-dependent Fis family transcriptional regulator, partial [Deltaproteobacteria bacterium]|nr:sigma-54-dependent Fis family transcriptional regulator [Deltaproteobacteria bacterium]
MSKKPNILIVGNEVNTIKLINNSLSEENYLFSLFQSARKALQKLKEGNFELVISEYRMPDMEGLEFLKEIRKINPKIKVIILADFSNVEAILEAIQEGAYDYLKKPFIEDELKILIRRALQENDQFNEGEIFGKEPIKGKSNKLIGRSLKMKKIFNRVRDIAKTDLTVLIQGETGTGKELIASTIHNLSHRRNKSFLRVNCAALSDSLLESELFGHEKGAFTGATNTKHGLFSAADEGSLLLDEISEANVGLQAKLLRVVENKEFIRVGGTKPIKIDVRLIVSTNRDLKKYVKQGKFRQDLYYRLNVFPIFIPPLRERVEDIPLLINYFLQNEVSYSSKKNISPEVLDCLLNYKWPGNVRELKNVISQAVVLCGNSRKITLKHLPEHIRESKEVSLTGPFAEDISFKEARKRAIEFFEKKYLQNLLYKNNGNVSESSRLAKLSRPYLHQMIKKYKIDPG